MDCALITRQNFAERYLLEKLSPEQREAYESHYFECDSCFLELQQLLAIREELEAQPSKAPVFRPEHRAFGAWWRWPALAAAAAVLVAAVILVPRYESVAPAPSAVSGAARAGALAALARVEPPHYEVRVLRGMDDAASAAFHAGMQDYLAGNYASAETHLREAAAADPSRPDIAFYLGATELLTGRPDTAQVEFERLIAMGETAFSEEAHFYLGKALLQQDRMNEARQEFQRAAAMDGALQAEARAVLEALEKIEPASPRR